MIPRIRDFQRTKDSSRSYFEGLRIAVQRLLGTEPGGKVIVLASQRPGEGVSTVTAGLARVFQKGGNGDVLVIDAGAGRVGVSEILGMSPDRLPADLLERDRNSASDYLVRTNRGITLLALEIDEFGGYSFGEAWDKLIAELRERFPIILVDGGTVSGGALRPWAGSQNRVLLIVDAGRSSVPVLERLSKELEDRAERIDGVILNKRRYYIPYFIYRFIN